MSLTLSGTDGVVGAGFTLDASGASVTAGVGTFGTLNVDDKIIHTADTDTAIRFPEANHISMETGGNERIRITSGATRVGIGTTNPQYALDISDGAGSGVRIGVATHAYRMRANVSSTDDYGFYIEDEEGTDLYNIRGPHATSNPNIHVFSTSGTERLRITSEGYVTGNVNVPCWFGSQDTEHNITTGTWTSLLNLGNSVINPTLNNGGWNESTGTFTAQTGQAGYYYCYGCAGIDDVQDADLVYCGISKNGADPIFYTENRALDQGANLILGGVTVAQVIQLAVGDTAQLRVYHNEGSTEPTEPNRCFFGGYRLAI